MTEHVFANPVEFEGEHYDRLDMNLDSLTGRDISKVKSQWAQAGNFSPIPAADTDFCMMIACHAAGLPAEFADVLPAREYLAITQKVSNFLLGSG